MSHAATQNLLELIFFSYVQLVVVLSQCFGLKEKLVCLRPDNVKNVKREVTWRNQVFCSM